MAYEDILKALLGDQDGLFSGTPLLAKSDTINPVYSAAQRKLCNQFLKRIDY